MNADFFGWVSVGCASWLLVWGLNRVYLLFKKLIS